MNTPECKFCHTRTHMHANNGWSHVVCTACHMRGPLVVGREKALEAYARMVGRAPEPMPGPMPLCRWCKAKQATTQDQNGQYALECMHCHASTPVCMTRDRAIEAATVPDTQAQVRSFLARAKVMCHARADHRHTTLDDHRRFLFLAAVFDLLVDI